MRSGKLSSFICLFLLAMGLSVLPAAAQQIQSDGAEYDPLRGNQEIKKLIKTIQEKSVGPEQYEVVRNQIDEHLRQGGRQQEILQKELQQIDASLKALGEKVEGESARMARERAGLNAARKLKEAQLAEFRLLAINAAEALKVLELKRQEGQRSRVMGKASPIWSFSAELRDAAGGLTPPDWTGVNKGLQGVSGHRLVVLLLSVAVGMWLLTRQAAKIEPVVGGDGNGSMHRFVFLLNRRSLSYRLGLGAAIGATAAFWLMLTHEDPPSFLPWLALSLLIALIVPLLVEALCLAAAGEVNDQRFSLLHRWQVRFSALGAALLTYLLAAPDLDVVPEAIYVVGRFAIVGCTCLVAALTIPVLSGFFPRLRQKYRMVCLVAWLAAAVVLYFEVFGFRALASHVLAGFAWSFLLYAGTALLVDIARIIYGILFRNRWRFFRQIGVRPDEEDEDDLLKGVGWLRAILKLLLAVAVVLLFVQIWDFSDVYAAAIFSFLTDGFHLGKILVVPARIVVGLLIFIIGWTLALWVKKILEQKWMREASFAPSTREALLTVIGYVCYVLAAIVGLSVAGVNFSGLAVIAGALSVGIGFGMQNIVNNFVSGLILLFERPIKRGDWIVAGTTEGYVKKISVRSTIIQTFDRADVIVPNSELISSPVTNMMFNDPRGRLRVSVGVAYGSDTSLVRSLLLEIAGSHPEVVVDGTSPRPDVFFMEFGESSLNFDLLCHLKNIDSKPRVRSEINFRIDDAFRQHGIEIPFPQRDIHIRTTS
ncbi:MAG: mechanosensitive ion channel [Desulfobulbaceae bacterium]|nr:MAG: mechanosensitive ion channel [Desulfobulbaceae bacterium]